MVFDLIFASAHGHLRKSLNARKYRSKKAVYANGLFGRDDDDGSMAPFVECDAHMLALVLRLLQKSLPGFRALSLVKSRAWTVRCELPHRPAAETPTRRCAMHATLRAEDRSVQMTIRGDGKVTWWSSGDARKRALGRLPRKVVPLCLTLLSKLPAEVDCATCRVTSARSDEGVFEELCRSVNSHEERPALVRHRHGNGETILCALASSSAPARTVRAIEEKSAKSAFFTANGVEKRQLRVCLEQSRVALGDPSRDSRSLPTIDAFFGCPQISRGGELIGEEGVRDDAYVMISDDVKEELRHSFESLVVNDDDEMLWVRLRRAVSEAFELPRSTELQAPLPEILCELAVMAVTRCAIIGRAAYPLLVFQDDALMMCTLNLFRTADMPLVDSMSTSYLALRGRQKVGDLSELCLKPHDPTKHYLRHVNTFREGHAVTWSYRSKSLQHRRAVVLIRLQEPALKTLEEARMDHLRLSRPAEWTERTRLEPSALVAVWTCACAYVRARMRGDGMLEFSCWEAARRALIARIPTHDIVGARPTRLDEAAPSQLKHLYNIFQLRKFRVRKLYDISKESTHHRICTSRMKAVQHFKAFASSMRELYAIVVSCTNLACVVKDRDGERIRVKLTKTDDNEHFRLCRIVR